MNTTEEYLDKQQHFIEMYSKMDKDELIREFAALHCFFNYVMDKLAELEDRLDEQEKTPFDVLKDWYNKA